MNGSFVRIIFLAVSKLFATNSFEFQNLTTKKPYIIINRVSLKCI